MMEDMLKRSKDAIEGKTCLISGAGNVATYAAEKINHLGGKVVTMSDSSGFVYDGNGIDQEKLEYIVDLKTVRRGGLEEFAKEYKLEFRRSERPWQVPCDLAFPCATQNEISRREARLLIENG